MMFIHVLYTAMFILLSICLLIRANKSEQHDTCPCYIYTTEMVADCELKGLTSVPECIPDNMRRLSLAYNEIIYSPGQFQRFRNLEELKLAQNIHFTARSDSFRSLYQLQRLDLGNTNFTYVTDDTFTDLHNLSDLIISGYIGQLYPNQLLFAPLKNLITLDVSEKMILEIQNYSFHELSKLEKLTLSNIYFLYLYTYSFEGLTALKSLSLANPETIYRLPEDIFKPLIHLEEIHLEGLCSALAYYRNCTTIDTRLKFAPSLKRIHIDNVLISYLGTGFQSLANLEELHMIRAKQTQLCNILYLDESYFHNLVAVPLTKLYLEYCLIARINRNAFSSIRNLSTLDFNIETVDGYTFLSSFGIALENSSIVNVRLSLPSIFPFKYLGDTGVLRESRLKSFELTRSTLTAVTSDTEFPKSLVHLILNKNRLHYFESLAFLENLETLDLSDQMEDMPRSLNKRIQPELNGMGIDQLNLREEENDTFAYMTLPYKLKLLNVRRSMFLCFMTSLFSCSNNSLQTLIASKQRDRSCIESNKFWTSLKNLVNLEELDLAWNAISEIPRNAFSRQSKLRTLSLNGNKLTELSFHVDSMVHIQTLDLSSNSIGYASSDFTQEIKDVAAASKFSLDLSGNPLVCDCKRQDFVKWLRDTNVILEKTKLNCTFENGTKISLSHISKIHDLLDTECIMIEVTIGCVATFLMLNLLLGSIAYTQHFRQKLGYLLSYGRRTLNPYHPIEDSDIEMEYDVYISYEGDSHLTPNETLRDFVIYKLLPGLERRGFKVGIREGFDPGSSLYEMISKAVRRSKKVLVLLTKDYCKDMWNVFEFNQAVMEGIYTDRQIAIPILFESLGRDTVKEELYAFLRMEPVARYSQDVSDRVFIEYVCERIRDTARKFN